MTATPLRIAPLTGPELKTALPALARLRIAVFRDWPYLYEGDLDYEEEYMRAYADSVGALVACAYDGDALVGAATAAPMEDHAAEFAAPFRAKGWDIGDILYCGESVLLPHCRGRGAGHAFFDAREAHGRALGRRHICFCAVVRNSEDPRRPPGHRTLDGFWRKRGYAPVEGLRAEYTWREVGATEPSAHPMQFWLRSL